MAVPVVVAVAAPAASCACLVAVVVVVVGGGGDAYLLSAGAGCSHMSGTAKRAVKSEGWTGCWRGGGAG